MYQRPKRGNTLTIYAHPVSKSEEERRGEERKGKERRGEERRGEERRGEVREVNIRDKYPKKLSGVNIGGKFYIRGVVRNSRVSTSRNSRKEILY